MYFIVVVSFLPGTLRFISVQKHKANAMLNIKTLSYLLIINEIIRSHKWRFYNVFTKCFKRSFDMNTHAFLLIPLETNNN